MTNRRLGSSVWLGYSQLSIDIRLSDTSDRLTEQPPTPTIQRVIKGHTVTVDAQDAHLLDEYPWTINPTGYVVTPGSDENGRTITRLLHRLITNAPKHLQVDHRDGAPLNNTRANLRLCTCSQNHANRRKFKNGTSIYKGVHLRKYSKIPRWYTVIKDNGILRNLGSFTDEQEAARAYDREALRLYGDFARLNFAGKE